MNYPQIRIALPPHFKALRIERNVAGRLDACGSWCLWVNANAAFTQGTYVKMYDNGRMERVTLDDDGSEHVFLIKDEDEET